MNSMHRSPRRPRQAPRELNLTSCIDVVFLLLIFFIVTTQFTDREGTMLAQLSGGDPPDPRPQMPLKVHVTSMGETGYRLDIQGHPVRPTSFGDLIAMMKQLQDDPAIGRTGLYQADNLVLIAPEEKVRWQHVVNAYNASRRAGFTQIAFDSPLP